MGGEFAVDDVLGGGGDLGGVFGEEEIVCVIDGEEDAAELVEGDEGAVAEADMAAEDDVDVLGGDLVLGHGEGDGEGGDEDVVPEGEGGWEALAGGGTFVVAEAEEDLGSGGGGGMEDDAIGAGEEAGFALEVGEGDGAGFEVVGKRLADGVAADVHAEDGAVVEFELDVEISEGDEGIIFPAEGMVDGGDGGSRGVGNLEEDRPVGGILREGELGFLLVLGDIDAEVAGWVAGAEGADDALAVDGSGGVHDEAEALVLVENTAEGGILALAEGGPFVGEEGRAEADLHPEEGEEEAGDPGSGHGGRMKGECGMRKSEVGWGEDPECGGSTPPGRGLAGQAGWWRVYRRERVDSKALGVACRFGAALVLRTGQAPTFPGGVEPPHSGGGVEPLHSGGRS